MLLVSNQQSECHHKMFGCANFCSVIGIERAHCHNGSAAATFGKKKGLLKLNKGHAKRVKSCKKPHCARLYIYYIDSIALHCHLRKILSLKILPNRPQNRKRNFTAFFAMTTSFLYKTAACRLQVYVYIACVHTGLRAWPDPVSLR